MCGLVFAVGPDVSRFAPRFAAALRSISHRGPDAKRIHEWPGAVFGHRRLSIIDLSDAANQPLFDDSGNAIIFNGEIYNYLEVREDLMSLGIRFNTASDTEVLLRAYTHWGPECLARFNGMWTFCIWDAARKAAFVSRDRFGVKPLYYAKVDENLLFASEPKAILALQPSLRVPNERQIARFLGLGELHAGSESFYEGIKSFPQSSWALVPAAAPALVPHIYWRLDLSRSREDHGESEASFAQLFESAVKLRLRSDVPVGLSLSGGLDSSAIAVAMKEGGASAPPCFTATYGDRNRGEEHWAAVAAAKTGATLIPVEAGREQWVETLRRIAWHMDGPGYSPAVYPAWRIMREARARGIPVILEGQGADELLAGYPQHGAVELRRMLSAARIAELPSAFGALRRTFGAKSLSGWILRQGLPAAFRVYRRHRSGASVLRPDMRAHLDAALPETPHIGGWDGASALNITLAKDFFRDILPNLLHYGDAISMAHSIESRLPFMDYRLVEWAFAAPQSAKLNHGQTKAVLRAYLRQRELPSIADRPDKQGYPTPTAEWLRAEGAHIVRDTVLAADSRVLAFCERSKLKSLFEATSHSDSVRSHLAYKLLSLEIWLRTCIDGTSADDATPSEQAI